MKATLVLLILIAFTKRRNEHHYWSEHTNKYPFADRWLMYAIHYYKPDYYS